MRRFALLLIFPLLLALAACGADMGEKEQVERPLPPAPPSAEELYAAELIAEMTLDEKVGQLFLCRCPQVNSLSDITTYHLGGYVLFGRDFAGRTPAELQQVLADYQAEAKLPLIIATDEEGGGVVRASAYKQYREQPFASPQRVYAEGGFAAIAADAAEKAQLLLGLGINVNLSPVADVSAESSYMGGRSFSDDADLTGEFVRTVVAEYEAAGLGAVLKHFPGYGDNVDTHESAATDTADWEDYLNLHLQPFIAGIEAGADAVLIAHNTVTCMDEQNPASLSQAVHMLLREGLNFDGVIICDDLKMDAIEEHYSIEEAAVQAILSGNDMLCCSDYHRQIPAVIEAVYQGRIAEARLDESVQRVLLWKMQLGLIEVPQK